MKQTALLALSVLALTLAACGSSSSSSSSPAASSSASSTPAGSGAVMVSMKSLAFSPAAVHAKVGQTVTWVNNDTPAHNVAYVSGPKFASSPTMNPGATYSVKLSAAGTIKYFCSIHPFMTGTIIVTP